MRYLSIVIGSLLLAAPAYAAQTGVSVDASMHASTTMSGESGDPDRAMVGGHTEAEQGAEVHMGTASEAEDAASSSDDNMMSDEHMGMDDEHESSVAASAREVRGWDAVKKEQFLEQVKEHAQVQSQQDLENFATGILLKDQHMEQVSLNFEKVKMVHEGHGRLLGFIPVTFNQTLEADPAASADARVKVKFPWYSFLMSTDVSASAIAEAAASTEGHRDWINLLTGSFADKAEALQGLADILQGAND